MSVESVQAQVARMAELAWAAGVLDCRGHFGASLRTARPGHYQPRVTFRPNNKRDEPFSEALCAILGGTVSNPGAYRQQRGVWTLSGAKACLEADDLLVPYLRIKVRRAQMHAELCRAIVEWKAPSFADRSLPPEELLRRAHLFQAMSRL